MRFISPEVAAGRIRWQSCADFGRHDIDVDAEETALPDRAHDRVDHAIAIAVGDVVHRVFHEVGALLVDALEFHRVERGLEVIARPDVMDAALAADQQLIDIGCRLSAGIVGPDIAFLMAAHADATAAGAADIAGRERDIHEGAVGPVIVVAPDQALLIGEHRPPSSAALFGLGDPARRLADIVGFEAR